MRLLRNRLGMELLSNYEGTTTVLLFFNERVVGAPSLGSTQLYLAWMHYAMSCLSTIISISDRSADFGFAPTYRESIRPSTVNNTVGAAATSY